MLNSCRNARIANSLQLRTVSSHRDHATLSISFVKFAVNHVNIYDAKNMYSSERAEESDKSNRRAMRVAENRKSPDN